MTDRTVTTMDAQIRDMLLGVPVMFPWEWSGLDGTPRAWARDLKLRATMAGLDVSVVEMPRRSISIAWDSARATSGVVVLPASDDLATYRRRPAVASRPGRTPLRLVRGLPARTRRRLRIVD